MAVHQDFGLALETPEDAALMKLGRQAGELLKPIHSPVCLDGDI
ncbi:hypothetical protein GGQ64_004956 [Rhizobium azooxidifex]|uniref:Uncharacterized protein n=1 Tax=Mycoplana azooxidifex TaxID=1636188 RepID=A0A7W6GL31_9HYPH|nr:hypothetical protein [Mycoplana azooxidifex]